MNPPTPPRIPRLPVWAAVAGLTALAATPAIGQVAPAPVPQLFGDSTLPSGLGDGPAPLAHFIAQPTTRRVRTAMFDAAALEADRLALNVFPDRELVAERQDIGFTGIGARSWTGRLPAGGSVALVIKGDRLCGSITSTEGSYGVYPLPEGQCAIVERNPGAYPGCGVEGNRPPALPDAGPAPADPAAPAPEEPAAADSNGDTPTGNRVRVLVAYTTSARDKTDTNLGMTMQELVDLAVVESNQGYANSGVTMRMELACLYHTISGTETTAIEDDVDNFRNSGDTKWNEVHGLRSSYDADMCCLIVDGRDTDWCGWSYGFDYTSYANMFQATSYSCATGNFTFAHEFGHTQGCRHNDDGGLTPFAYGHGFRNGSNWRTIMGLSNDTGAIRLNYWSNPAINSPVAPFTALGTAIDGNNFANDCESALDVGDATVVNHETTPASSGSPAGDTFNNDEGADKLVTGTLTVGTFAANSGSRVQFRAGDQIVLQPGFRARVGSVFRARLAGPLGDPAPGPADPADENTQTSTQEPAEPNP